MLDRLLFSAIGSTILVAGLLLLVLQTERRKARFAALVRSITTPAPAAGEPAVSLRRPRPQRTALPARLSRQFDLALAAAGARIRPWHIAAAGLVAGITVGFAASAVEFRPIFAIAAGSGAAVGAPILLLRIGQRRYQRQFLELFPDALDLIVRAVKAGLPAAEAIELVTREIRPPVATELKRLVDELRIGTEMEEALQHAADRIRLPDFRFFAVALLVQRQTGGGIADTLSNLSAIIRQRKALRQKARALAAEAHASAAVVATAPFAAGVGLFLINPDLVSVLFTDPRGRFMLGLAITGLVLGIAIMRAIIGKNLR
jgi:tight adherence protein B